MGWTKLTQDMQEYVQGKGWLRNPKTGRIFRANLSNIRRPEFQRISGPDADSKEISAAVSTADEGTAAVVPGEEVHVGGADADEALNEVLERMKRAKDKKGLVRIGVDLGLTLKPERMTIKVMREKIEEHVQKLRSFT